MVTSWILNSLAKEISDSVEYVNDSVELWRELEDRYDQTNGAKLYLIQKEINDLVQESLDITAYYTRKKLWEELSNLSAKSQCTFSNGLERGLHNKARKHFNDETPTILGIGLLLLLQEEKQREFKPNNRLSLESTSLHVNVAPSQHQNPFGARNFKTHYTSNNKGRPFYDYRIRPGQTKDKCYKLHGYPQNNSHNNQNSNRTNTQQFNQGNNSGRTQGHKFNRGKGAVANVHGVPADLLHEKEDDLIL
ncbi:PREDICTED: uncharacterized protein LOC109211608 [Nicotiana attenuata]|uniref:uncharacterized protein LOC109211608 n=1 Tax=Nicotiana attenuata TaxID=49451 RepID=UPI00090504D0|nr:PREDICTED: uncharacterized protein LOC109211608 [Nicotiana attenuata]